jgi:hypothetical protein
MEAIPEEIVEETLREVAGFSLDRAKKETMTIGNKQPERLAFVTESSQEMGQGVRELASYMFVVVYRMFQESHGKIQKISSKQIIECYENNEGLMETLEGAHERFIDRIACLQTSRQPCVVKYVVDALMEDDGGEEAEVLTDEQKNLLYLRFNIVIDVLDVCHQTEK